jgi:protein gp37
VRKVTSAANWHDPLKWERAARKAGVRAKVFCASLADVFEAEAPVKARRDLWKIIGDTCGALDWMLLTKRPERITEVMVDDGLNLESPIGDP